MEDLFGTIFTIMIVAGILGGLGIVDFDKLTDEVEEPTVAVAPVEVETAPVAAPVEKTVAKVVVSKKEPTKPTEDVIVELTELDTKVIDKKILDVELTETKVESDAPLFIDLK